MQIVVSSESPVRLLVGFSQGSVSNIVAQLLAPSLGRILGRPIELVSMPGDNGGLAAQCLAQSAPDGNTLAMAVPTHLVGSLLGQSSRYNPLSDFCPVHLIARNAMALAVANDLGVESVAGLIELARVQPAALAYGASAVGGGPHLCAVLFEALTGTRLSRKLYAETNILFQDLARGDIALTFNNPTSILQLARQGKLKVLATTGGKVDGMMPGVPILAEAVPGLEFISWVGLLAPAHTPPRIISSLHAAIRSALDEPDVEQGLRALGLARGHGTAADFAAHLHAEFKRWTDFAHAHQEAFPGLRSSA